MELALIVRTPFGGYNAGQRIEGDEARRLINSPFVTRTFIDSPVEDEGAPAPNERSDLRILIERVKEAMAIDTSRMDAAAMNFRTMMGTFIAVAEDLATRAEQPVDNPALNDAIADRDTALAAMNNMVVAFEQAIKDMSAFVERFQKKDPPADPPAATDPPADPPAADPTV